jgi:diguanylate cyclase (GGDEF)-like protein
VFGSLALAIAYFLTARLCVYLANTGVNPAAIWIPGGIALAGLLYFGPGLWPGVLLGSLAANLVVDLSVGPAVLLALGNALMALVGAVGVRRVTDGKHMDFGRLRHVLAYIVYGAVIGPAISGALGIFSLHLVGMYDSLPEALSAWAGWSLEDGLSVLLVCSALLLAIQTRHLWREPRQYVESALLLGLLAITAWVILSRPHSDPLSQPYLVLPVLLWVVLRMGVTGAVVGNLLLTVLAGMNVVDGKGPFALVTLTDSMVWMQAFSSIVCLTTLLLAAALREARADNITARRKAEAALRESEERLQLVARATNDAVLDWDIRANTIWHNDALRAICSEAAGTIGTGGLAAFVQYIHPDDREAVLAHLQQAMARSDATWSHEYRLKRDESGYAHVLARGYVLYEGATAVRLIGVLLDLSERKQLEEELAYRATHDVLTELANRALIETTLDRAVRQGSSVSLLIADLDGFKEINDTLGHQAGDKVLQVVALRWRDAVREGDLVGRLAGDEFALVLPGADAVVAAAIAERIVSALDEPIVVNNSKPLRVRASIGLATCPTHAADVESLLRAADQAMYLSKRGGGGFLQLPDVKAA